MKKLQKRDTAYYFGLFFLLLSSGSLLMCILKDNFQLIDYLVFLLFFSWGFGLLWKSDYAVRFALLEGEMENMRTMIAGFTRNECEEEPQTGQSENKCEECMESCACVSEAHEHEDPGTSWETPLEAGNESDGEHGQEEPSRA